MFQGNCVIYKCYWPPFQQTKQVSSHQENSGVPDIFHGVVQVEPLKLLKPNLKKSVMLLKCKQRQYRYSSHFKVHNSAVVMCYVSIHVRRLIVWVSWLSFSLKRQIYSFNLKEWIIKGMKHLLETSHLKFRGDSWSLFPFRYAACSHSKFVIYRRIVSDFQHKQAPSVAVWYAAGWWRHFEMLRNHVLLLHEEINLNMLYLKG